MGAGAAGMAQAAGQATGGIISAYGTIAAAQAERDAQLKVNALRNQQAQEILDREKINEEIAQRQGNLDIADALASRSVSGAGGGTGSTGFDVYLHQNLAQQLSLMRRDAEFKASMIRANAAIDMGLADANVRASYIGAAGSILSGGSAAAGTAIQNTKNSSAGLDETSGTKTTSWGSDYGGAGWRNYR